MKYSKVIRGWVEVLYTFEGKPLSVKFVQNESEPIERRAQREASDGPETDDQLGEDELIEHPADLEYLEQNEKFCNIEMVQP